MVTIAMAERIQADIETMTRRLELEKRRLHRLDKDLVGAQRTYEVKASQLPRPSSRSGARTPGASRPTADVGHVFLPKTGSVRGSALPGHGAWGEGEPWRSPMGEDIRGFTRGCGTNAYQGLLHRLDVQVKKLDSIRHGNAKLQQEIDQIRRQRLQLNNIFERLKVEIRQRASQLMEVSEETITGKTVQSDAKHRIAVMQRQRETERGRFKAQLTKLRKELKDYDFEAKEVEVKIRREQDLALNRRELVMPPEETDFSEQAMMRRIMKTAFLNCIQRRHIKQHEKTIAVYEQAFATIKQSTGISNIEEIVRIFVQLESKNYSLLTYVNHMNAEIEVLEALRLRRQAADKLRCQHEATEEHNRERTLGVLQKQVEAKQLAIAESREACARHQDVIQQFSPFLEKVCRRIQREFERIKQNNGFMTASDMPQLPLELRPQDIPVWLSWAEKALGRFRDLVPHREKESCFPPTARAQIVQLAPKKVNAAAQPLLRAQELPCSISLQNEDMTSQKRGPVTAAQKAEILDEEAEEEDFADRPLTIRDIRQRAEKAAMRRRKRARPHSDSLTPLATLVGDKGAMSRNVTPGDDRPSGHRVTQSDEEARESANGHACASRRGSTGGALAGEPVAEGNALSENEPTPAAPPSKMPGRTAKMQNHLIENDLSAISEKEVEQAFVNRYNMTVEEVQIMCDRMGVHMNYLCYMKLEFDKLDQDQSGYIDASELKLLLERLGDDISEEDLQAAFKNLDADGSGEIEFFEFAEWFTT
mmetsp:Transcript_26832/g.77585  ORF Transcript_26832/g.77585 Transcript_26832/m.77585 type:complete len:763 (+) Transcript_26832:113-2401(+)